jgi:hypothetical protein
VAFTYDIAPDRRIVTVCPESPPSLDDWENLLDRVAADPRFRIGFHVLSDRRHLNVEPDAVYVRSSIEAVSARRASFGHSRFAVLTSHLATYGMARMAEALAENRGIQWCVFMDPEEAAQWLAQP